MRKFRFKGDPKNYILWDKKPVFDMVYNKEDYRKYRGGPDCDYVFDNVLPGMDDWKEVFEEPQVFNRVGFNEKIFHKDTDLGAFSIEIMKVLVAKNYDPVTGLCNSCEDLASVAKYAAQALIKQLDQ